MSTLNRHTARECVMQVLFAVELRKEPVENVSPGILREEFMADEKLKDFIQKLLKAVLSNLPEIDKYITKHADNWDLSRMAIIDKNLMRMALAEILFLEDIPPKVSINEAIEIAKVYSTEKSGRFINGILDAALIELKREGRINKVGRGLVDLPAKHPKDQQPMPPSSSQEGQPPLMPPPPAENLKRTTPPRKPNQGKPGIKRDR